MRMKIEIIRENLDDKLLPKLAIFPVSFTFLLLLLLLPFISSFDHSIGTEHANHVFAKPFQTISTFVKDNSKRWVISAMVSWAKLNINIWIKFYSIHRSLSLVSGKQCWNLSITMFRKVKTKCIHWWATKAYIKLDKGVFVKHLQTWYKMDNTTQKTRLIMNDVKLGRRT